MKSCRCVSAQKERLRLCFNCFYQPITKWKALYVFQLYVVALTDHWNCFCFSFVCSFSSYIRNCGTRAGSSCTSWSQKMQSQRVRTVPKLPWHRLSVGFLVYSHRKYVLLTNAFMMAMYMLNLHVVSLLFTFSFIIDLIMEIRSYVLCILFFFF